MRKLFIAGNWKMHKTIQEAVALAKAIATAAENPAKRLLIAPPFTALSAVASAVKGSKLLLGAQNMGPEEKGAHTGEISVLMLKDVGINVVILGHSERRHVYHEENELINRKVCLALRHGLGVILCVGETLAEREDGITTQVIEEQLTRGLEGVTETQLKRVALAYEPVWAIGTGKTATPGDADEIHRFIRVLLSRLYNPSTAERTIIQYGGSVKPGNASELLNMKNIDGVLVGGASLSAEDFLGIINADTLKGKNTIAGDTKAKNKAQDA